MLREIWKIFFEGFPCPVGKTESGRGSRAPGAVSVPSKDEEKIAKFEVLNTPNTD